MADLDIPDPGLGTSGNDDPEQCAETVATALELGYRHVDTAQGYDNEAAVGEGLARAEIDREDVFLATKVAPANLAHDDVLDSARESLDRLGVDYVDLLYVHWPMGAYDPEDTLSAFDRLREEGVTRHVGVSNFTPDLLDEAREILDSPIAAHQFEMHPLLRQEELRAHTANRGIPVVAYSPVIRGRAAEVDVLVDVAERRDATPAQVSLAWLRRKDAIPIPKATGETHLRENLEPVALTDEDVRAIDAIDREERLIDPDDAPWNR